MNLKPIVLFTAACLGAASAHAQSWSQLIANQWPAGSIRKVSEKDFEAFVAAHVGMLGKAGAYDAFLTAQSAAYGLPTGPRDLREFAVPSADRRLVATDRPFDALVHEGAEPNGSPNAGGVPTPISCGDQGEGAIDLGGDQDWFRFTLTSATTVQVLTGPGLAGAGLPGAVPDTVVEIYDAAFNLVAFNDDYTVQYTSAIRRGNYSFCEAELGAGTYYASVRAFGVTQTGTYSFDLRCTQPFQIVAEGAEPNDDPNLGGTPTLLAVDQQGDGECVLPAGDHDWWVFTVQQPTALLIGTGPSLQRGNNIGDSILAVWDPNGTNLGSDDDGGPAAYSQLELMLQPGTYFADVGGYNGAPGTYRVWLATIPIPTSPVAEAIEPNGDPRNGGAPSPIGCDQTGAGEIANAGGPAPTGDVDWWSFTTTRAGLVTLYTMPDPTSTSGSSTIGDTELWLRDAQFTQLAYDDDNGIGLFSELSMWLAPGTYFAHVEGYGATDVGRYFLIVECSGGLPGFATLAAGCAGSNGRVPSVTTRDLELAILGTTFVADFVNLPPNGPLFPFFGFSRTQTTSGYALPLDLGLIGAPGCFIASDPLVALNAQATAFGTHAAALAIPLSGNLVGVTLYTQAVVLDAAANALGATTSDVGAIVFGNRL